VRYRKDGKIEFTSVERAKAYEAAGVLKPGPDGILVLQAEDYRVVAAAKLAARRRLFHGDGLASLAEIQGVPIIHAREMLRGKWVEELPRDYAD